MKKQLTTLASLGVCLAAGSVLADDHEGDDGFEPAVPLEMFVCEYTEGNGPEELADVIAEWNDWADDRDLNNYSAWTLAPYYAGPEQEFDFLWVGGASSATEPHGR